MTLQLDDDKIVFEGLGLHVDSAIKSTKNHRVWWGVQSADQNSILIKFMSITLDLSLRMA